MGGLELRRQVRLVHTVPCCSVLQAGPGNNEYEEGYEYDKKSVQGNNYG